MISTKKRQTLNNLTDTRSEKEEAGVLNLSSSITEETEDGMNKTKSVQEWVPILLAKKLAKLS